MKISVILPHVIRKPGGGTKIMYEFANQLHTLGHDVIVYNCIQTSPFKLSPFRLLLKRLYLLLFKHPGWYKFNKGIKSIIIKEINNGDINDAEVIFFTGWSLTYDLQKLDNSKGQKFNLIQDLEFWTGDKKMIIDSYLFKNIIKLTYSNHIKDYIGQLGEEVYKVSINVDRDFFKINMPIESREKGSICMMYSTEERKGSKFGLEALLKLKEQNNNLTVHLFGTSIGPSNLPEGFHYYQTPQNLPYIMNSCSIFLTPSLWEGYGIPGIEAMHCGCAVVCSDAEGHMMYAKDNETAIVFKAGNTEYIIQALLKLLNNDSERIRIAKNGNRFILNQKSWEDCASELVEIFEQNV
ncbi:glycosyltransferase family 4 protein [Mucilaginibacter sp. Mucisp86]|uniref:glycosyltransferase family 4 protein n=1 Tax=Mucilaginibacter sp. Mucisp86 TaxID=3243060 RepID=UPI0039B6CC4D